MIDDAQLIAWLDGELTPDAAKMVAAAVAKDPDLAARAAAHRALSDRLGSGFSALLEQPLPQRLMEAAGGSGVVDLERARNLRTPAAIKTRHLSLPPWARIAAIVPVVFAAGYVTHLAAPKGILSDRGGELVATGKLAHALDTQLASSPTGVQDPGAPRIHLSFRARNGQICRTWTAERQSGIACRAGEAWTIAATAARSSDGELYRMASAGDPGLLATMDALVAEGPFDATQEARLRAAQWR
jgi:hypothetical protein